MLQPTAPLAPELSSYLCHMYVCAALIVGEEKE